MNPPTPSPSSTAMHARPPFTRIMRPRHFRSCSKAHAMISQNYCALNVHEYFFQHQYYFQIQGVAMRSLMSLIICSLYMDDFERRELESAVHPPHRWKRYVDDTHTALVKAYAQEFTDNLNSIDDDIKRTQKGQSAHSERYEKVNISNRAERALGFLDTCSVINDDGSIKDKVYRKRDPYGPVFTL